VDIFYHHRPDESTPLEETLGALDHAVRSGKALYVGLSNYSGEQTCRALEVCERNGFAQPIIHQPSYSLLNRRIESDLLPTTRESGLGVIAFCPLQQGLLTNKYLHGVPDDSRAATPNGFLKRDAIQPEVMKKVSALNEVAKVRGQSLAQMALSWTLRDEAVTSALIGASRPLQIEENLAAANNTNFDSNELERIEAILNDI
jgi:L-glyceraldehyde 3-phosphate reductase